MGSSNTKEQFLRQMEQIVEGVKQNRLKVTSLIFNLIHLKWSVKILIYFIFASKISKLFML